MSLFRYTDTEVVKVTGKVDKGESMGVIRVVLYSRDPELEPLLSSALKPGIQILWEHNTEKLKESTSDDSADLLLLDFDHTYCPREEQVELFEQLRDSRIPIIIMADDTRKFIALEFLEKGAFDCIRKPPSIAELRVVLRRASEHALMKRELAAMRESMRLRHSCDQLLGSSGRMQVIYDLIRRVADLNAYVLITGESGTGKELVARAIHNLSRRAEEPFLAVSCGAIPESLIESELFGYEKGSFTGANGARAGHFENAGEGTLLLDEIGELSLSTQVKLLRVLQEKEFTRLGSSKPIPLKARVLFATHRNLGHMVETGRFRRDLFFRVDVMSIHVPPLRDRTEDIPLLARRFLASYAEEYQKPVHDILPSAMELLVEYAWPGNVRELENVIQGSLIRCDNGSLGAADLPSHLRQLAEVPQATAAPGSFDQVLRQFKINLAHQAILDCNGNKTLAARKLRVSRTYLHRLIRMRAGGGDTGGEVANDASVA